MKFIFWPYLKKKCQTCKALYYASHQTHVWTRALTDLNLAHGAFLPTFELDQLTAQELAKVTTAPTRWLATMRQRYHRQLEQPHVDLRWKPSTMSLGPIRLGLDAGDEARALYLVPGGHFDNVYASNLGPWACGKGQCGGTSCGLG